MMPSHPNWFSTPVGSGMNGCQLAGFTKNAPTAMNARLPSTWMATMTLLTVADSDTPSTSNKVTASVTNTAGRLNSDFTTALSANGTTVDDGRWITDSAGTVSAVPEASSRRWPVEGSSALL